MLKKIAGCKFLQTNIFRLIVISFVTTLIFFQKKSLLLYGDAESHLNIAKRVVHGLTPGLAQLGGVWLPLYHILLIPFIWIEPLYRSGTAGSIVSMISYIILGIYFYKLLKLITKNNTIIAVGLSALLLNPNLLYLQSVPMTETLFLALFMASVYYFTRWWKTLNFNDLILTSFFLLSATLTRYESWFLTFAESSLIASRLLFLKIKEKYKKAEGMLFFHGIIAYAGIFGWIFWNLLILGNPLYFSESQYSSSTQQKGFLARGELPAYHNISESIKYFFGASIANIGIFISLLTAISILAFVFTKDKQKKFFVILLLAIPIFFSVISLYTGNSIILVPGITPKNFHWQLFNIRYGLLFLPFASYLIAVSSSLLHKNLRIILILLIISSYLFMTVKGNIITYLDGKQGLSSAKKPYAQLWISKNYDNGLVLIDDYSRSVSIISSGIPMQNIIYVGNKPYWEESLKEPEKYANWIIMQKNDEVWTHIYENKQVRGRLYKYFQKVYTSPEILIFRRNKL